MATMDFTTKPLTLFPDWIKVVLDIWVDERIVIDELQQ